MKRRSSIGNLSDALYLTQGSAGFSSLFFIVFSILLMLISAFRPNAFDSWRTQAADAFAPVMSVMSQPFQKLTVLLRNFEDMADLKSVNMRLEEENERLREWYQAALLLEAENRSLRDLLNVKIDPENSFITARVISDSGNSYVKSLIVLAGAKDNLQKGQSVLNGQGLIGRIVDVGEETARILMITDISSRVPVVVEDTQQHAILAGQNNDHPRLIHMPNDTNIEAGARIVTSGHGGIFPQGLPVGRVAVDERGEKFVELYADVSHIQHVRVVKREDADHVKKIIPLIPKN